MTQVTIAGEIQIPTSHGEKLLREPAWDTVSETLTTGPGREQSCYQH